MRDQFAHDVRTSITHSPGSGGSPESPGSAVVVACGALAGELRAVLDQLGVADAVEVRYLPAPLHNRPDQIVPALSAELDTIGDGRRVLVGYADCGTGGELDRYLAQLTAGGADVVRLPGAHCYEMFAGAARFAELHDAEPGTFYLTDFLARHFDALVWQGLGLDRHPALRDAYFGNYTRLVLLSQSDDVSVLASARDAAQRLGLDFAHLHVGRTELASAVSVQLTRAVV